MKWIYAVFCILGFVLPYYFFIPTIHLKGLSIPEIVKEIFASPITAFFAMDVIVSSLVLWAFIYQETRKRKIKLWWLSIIANLLVGVSLGFPLFLLLREFSKENQTSL
jgi:Terpene cyclase DEP1